MSTAAHALAFASSSGSRVVLLVHGFQGFGGGPEYRCLPEPLAYPAQSSDFGLLGRQLYERGLVVYVARYTSNAARTERLDESARCLSEQILAARRWHDVPSVTVVAHSMGGIVSRAYVEGPDYRGDVAALVTLGAPHHGIPGAGRLLTLLYGLPFGLDCQAHPGACELFPERMEAFNARHQPRPDVAYDLVGGTRGWLLSWLIGGADDGVIGVDSAVGARMAADGARRWLVHDAHSDFGGTVTDHYLASEDTLACLAPALGLDAARGVCRSTGARGGGARRLLGPADVVADGAPLGSGAAVPHADGSAGWALWPGTPVRRALLPPGAAIAVPVVLDGATARVVVRWSGAAPGLALRAPDGALSDAGNVELAWPGSRVTGASWPDPAGGVTVFELAAPRPGTWFVHAAAGTLTAALAVFAAMDSDIQLAVEVPPAVAPGSVVVLRGRLTAPREPAPDGLFLTARVGSGATARGAVTLAAAADGAVTGGTDGTSWLLALPVRAPQEPGLHLVSLQLGGTLTDGTALEREEQRVLEVVPRGDALHLPFVAGRSPGPRHAAR